MSGKYENAMKAFPNIMGMLGGLSRDIWYIFLPGSSEDLFRLELNIIGQKLQDSARERVMALQELCGLPLRPNETIEEVRAKARLQGKRNSRIFDDFMNRSDDPDDNPPGYHDT